MSNFGKGLLEAHREWMVVNDEEIVAHGRKPS